MRRFLRGRALLLGAGLAWLSAGCGHDTLSGPPLSYGPPAVLARVGGRTPGAYDSPDDIFVDAAGKVYLRDNAQMLVFAAAGQPEPTIRLRFDQIPPGHSQGGAYGILRSGEYLSLDGSSRDLLVFAADGTFSRVITAPPGLPPGRWQAQELVVDAADRCYILEPGVQRVFVLDATGALLGIVGRKSSERGGLLAADGLAVAPDGSVFVGDHLLARITHFSLTGEWLGDFSFGALGQVQYSHLALTPEGHLLRDSENGGGLDEFTPEGELVRTLTNPPVVTHYTVLLRVGPDGRILLESTGGLFWTREDGTEPQPVGHWYGAAPGEFARLSDLTAGPEGSVFALDGPDLLLRRVDLAGVERETWKFNSTVGGLQLRNVTALTTGPDGRALAIDLQNARVVRFDPGGTWAPLFDLPDVQTDAGSYRWYLVAAADGSFFLLSEETRTLYHLAPDGRVLTRRDIRIPDAGDSGRYITWMVGTRDRELCAMDNRQENLYYLGGDLQTQATIPIGALVRDSLNAYVNFMAGTPEGGVVLALDGGSQNLLRIDRDGHLEVAWSVEDAQGVVQRRLVGLSCDAQGRVCVGTEDSDNVITVFAPWPAPAVAGGVR